MPGGYGILRVSCTDQGQVQGVFDTVVKNFDRWGGGTSHSFEDITASSVAKSPRRSVRKENKGWDEGESHASPKPKKLFADEAGPNEGEVTKIQNGGAGETPKKRRTQGRKSIAQHAKGKVKEECNIS